MWVASCCAVHVQMHVQLSVLILYVEPLPVLVTFDVSRCSHVLWVRYWAHPWGCYNIQVLCVHVQGAGVRIAIFYMSVAAPVKVCICDYFGVHCYSSLPLDFLELRAAFFFCWPSLTGIWFKFEFISRLYRVSPLLSGFPLYSHYTWSTIKILILDEPSFSWRFICLKDSGI